MGTRLGPCGQICAVATVATKLPASFGHTAKNQVSTWHRSWSFVAGVIVRAGILAGAFRIFATCMLNDQSFFLLFCFVGVHYPPL